MNKQRPVFFNLMAIQMPVGSVTSILHRITGVLLAIGTPLVIYLLGLSSRDEQGYTRVTDLFAHTTCKLLLVLFVWALSHHMLAGVRHLLSDIDVGSDLPMARKSAWFVNCSAMIIALLFAVVML